MRKSKKQQEVIDQTAAYISQKFEDEASGHDWHHIRRVWEMARHLAKKEQADYFVVEMGALLHDIADWKSHDDDAGTKAAQKWLEQFNLDPTDVEHICDIVANVSFKGLGQKNKIKSLEGKIAQDADRLDAIGAIAIARVFAYGGTKGRPIHNPAVALEPLTDAEYRAANSHSNRSGIHHFYDKLLHLKDRMNTKSARQIAERRHKFMEKYLKEFFSEWGDD